MQDILSEKATVEELVAAAFNRESLQNFVWVLYVLTEEKLLEMHHTLYLEQREIPPLYAKNQEESRI